MLIEVSGKMIEVDPAQLARDLDRAFYEDSLYEFLKAAWPYIDPAPFVDGWAAEAVAEHAQAVIDGDIKRLLVNIPPRCLKSSLLSVALPAWTWAQPWKGPTSGPKVPFLYASYARQLSLRDSRKSRQLIESPWYQALWGDRFRLASDSNTIGRFTNDKGGERLITSVGSAATGEGGNIIVADDPNAADEALSEATTESTIDWWDGTMSTRLNDPKTGAFIVVQQRLGEDDLTGHIVSKDDGEWTHLVLPMRYEPERSFVTGIGWKDPRTEPGELLWPARFGEPEVKALERSLGPWKCNPAEAPILMADLTMKPIGDIRVGDQVIGFDKKQRTDGKRGRFKLTRTTVTEIHKHVAPVVKMTLDSGEVIRCTRDHKWYVGKDRGGSRELYRPVMLGRSKLARVCPAKLPELSREDERLAGWLSGFFDGEGSVSLCRRPDDPGDYRGSNIISFYQGSGRNKPLCDKLEVALSHFGFEYSFSEDERKPNKDAPCYGYRCYRIKKNGLPTFQKFLHIVQPTKWRDRIIEGVYGTGFIQGREKVVSIEDDGVETVYGLTTTTGNYVAWGLASSNSAGQLQQRPEPAGGGVIKRDWWQLWEHDAFPPMDFVLASLDTAYTTKTENDFSALTVWGVFSLDPNAVASRVVSPDGRTSQVQRSYTEQAPKVMLMHAWQERLELHDLVAKVAKTCKALKVDKIIIESKAAGISVGQELRRLYNSEDFSVQLFDPKSQDKLSRLYSVQHIYSEGMVYAPDKTWAEMVITQVGTFPKGKHDDLVDTCSQALRHLRDLGMLVRGPERLQEIEDMKQFRGRPPGPLYPA